MSEDMTPERLALVEKYRAELAKLSDAKLAKKIRHLKGAVGRCTLERNAVLMLAFLDAALSVARSRSAVLSGATNGR